MLPVTYRLIPQSGVSTYRLNTADTPVFPDIPEHAPNPSRLRLAHDSLAINSEFRLEPECVVEFLRNTSNFQKAGKLFVSIWTILMIHIPNIMKVTKEDNFLTQNVHLFMKLYMP